MSPHHPAEPWWNPGGNLTNNNKSIPGLEPADEDDGLVFLLGWGGVVLLIGFR